MHAVLGHLETYSARSARSSDQAISPLGAAGPHTAGLLHSAEGERLAPCAALCDDGGVASSKSNSMRRRLTAELRLYSVTDWHGTWV